MNSYRNFSPSPRNGWIIAWMNNYSVRFLHQREWDKVTPPSLYPFPFDLSTWRKHRSKRNVRPTNLYRDKNRSRRIIFSTQEKKRRNKQRKKEILLLREKEKKNDDSFASLDNRPSQELTPYPPTFTSIPRICPRITAFRYLVAPPDYINFMSDEPWMNGYRSGIPTRAPPVLSRACNTG